MNEKSLDRRRLQVPREDRSSLVEPSFGRVGALVDENLRRRQDRLKDCCGFSLAKNSHLARAELLSTARRWTAEYRNIPSEPPDPQGLIYLTGHQPGMPHPGVWLKNFVLDRMARIHGATAVHLIVDNDVPADTSLPVPGGTILDPHLKAIAFDRADPQIPYEERRIEDRDVFADFGRRATEQIAPLVADPLIEQYWPLVCERAAETDRLGACLAQARHVLEGAWGLDTLEVPLSRLCAGEAFAWFVACLLDRLPDFRTIHNEEVLAYRRGYHVRSTSHPAPELADDGDRIEAPFWVWTADDPRRRRLFCARATGDEIVLSDRQTPLARLPLRDGGDLRPTAESLLALQQRSIRIRPRALSTTLWARLCLGDLFLHGVGGAKYDQVTDRIIERFFGLRPPGFMVVSATLLLPIERDRATRDDARAAQRALRELDYHPERHLDAKAGPAADLIAMKRRWIETTQTAENAKQRHEAIRRLNAAMQPWLADRRRQILDRQTQTLQKLRAEDVLARRDYAFALYPEATLREFFSRLLHKMA